jgi:hypothetical protein
MDTKVFVRIGDRVVNADEHAATFEVDASDREAEKHDAQNEPRRRLAD